MTTPPRSKIYTKKGDRGKTALVDGSCVEKFNPRVEAYGTIDELNANIGLFLSLMPTKAPNEVFQRDWLEISNILSDTQSNLFTVGSLLANSQPSLFEKLPSLQPQAISDLELLIDQLDHQLPPLKNFILPQGHSLSCQAHVLRTICRRAERRTNEVEPLLTSANAPEQTLSSENSSDNNKMIQSFEIIQAYLNRLSDFFFVLSRWVQLTFNIPETSWTPKKP